MSHKTELMIPILNRVLMTVDLRYQYLVKCCDLTNFPGKSRVTPLVYYKGESLSFATQLLRAPWTDMQSWHTDRFLMTCRLPYAI